MSRRTATIEQTASWDLVVTTSGVTLLIVPHWLDINVAVAADDGIILDGKRPIHLMGSDRIVPYVRQGTHLILVMAGNGPSIEKIVPVVIHNDSLFSRRYDDESAAA